MGDVIVLAICGLKREAKMVARPGVITLASGGDVATLAARIEAALTPHVKAIISIGVAGALDSGLKVGDAVVAADIVPVSSGVGATVNQPWADRLSSALPTAKRGTILGCDHMVVDAAAKALLHQKTGALCVDMESHIAAEAGTGRNATRAFRRLEDAQRMLFAD